MWAELIIMIVEPELAAHPGPPTVWPLQYPLAGRHRGGRTGVLPVGAVARRAASPSRWPGRSCCPPGTEEDDSVLAVLVVAGLGAP